MKKVAEQVTWTPTSKRQRHQAILDSWVESQRAAAAGFGASSTRSTLAIGTDWGRSHGPFLPGHEWQLQGRGGTATR